LNEYFGSNPHFIDIPAPEASAKIPLNGKMIKGFSGRKTAIRKEHTNSPKNRIYKFKFN